MMPGLVLIKELRHCEAPGAAYEEVLTHRPAAWTLLSRTPGNQGDAGLGYQSLRPAIREWQGATLSEAHGNKVISLSV